MEATTLSLAVIALAAGVLLPGIAVARLFMAGRDALAQLAVALCAGRVLFGAASAAALSSASAGALWLYVAGGVGLGLAALVSAIRMPSAGGGGASSRRPWLLAAAAVLGGAALLVVGVVARSGLGEGTLVFRGHDSSLDPIVYASYALRLTLYGLPFRNAFAADAFVAGSTVPMSALAGLHVLGVPVLDLAFRVLPAFDVASLGLTSLALLRTLGASARPAAAATLLLLLGGDASAWIAPLGQALGLDARVPEPFLLFGPFLLAFNPVAAGLQTWLAALLLLFAPGARAFGRALLAGAFFAALFEIKVFLWAPVLGGLALCAVLAPSPALARRIRVAVLAAVLLSLPLVLMRMAGSESRAAGDETGLALCIGCMPRWFLRASLGGHSLSTDLFDSFRAADLLDPRTFGAVLGGAALMLGFGLGARLLLLPQWLRSARHGGEAAVLFARHVLASGGLGVALACTLVTTPHQTNGVQLAWTASFVGWLSAAWALPRWWHTRRWLALAGLLLLLAPGCFRALGPLGFAAPARFAVSSAERAFAAEVARRVAPGELVLEPSILRDLDIPSSLPFLANRPVYLSLHSAVQALPRAEQERRLEHLIAVFLERDGVRAREALQASGARFVAVPAGWPPLAAGVTDLMEAVVRHEAGTLFRVRDPVLRKVGEGKGA
jgi:hypothetical protein